MTIKKLVRNKQNNAVKTGINVTFPASGFDVFQTKANKIILLEIL